MTLALTIWPSLIRENIYRGNGSSVLTNMCEGTERQNFYMKKRNEKTCRKYESEKHTLESIQIARLGGMYYNLVDHNKAYEENETRRVKREDYKTLKEIIDDDVNKNLIISLKTRQYYDEMLKLHFKHGNNNEKFNNIVLLKKGIITVKRKSRRNKNKKDQEEAKEQQKSKTKEKNQKKNNNNTNVAIRSSQRIKNQRQVGKKVTYQQRQKDNDDDDDDNNKDADYDENEDNNDNKRQRTK